MDHHSSLANFINVANEADDVMAQKKELMKQIRSKEKNLTRRAPPNLIKNIERFVVSFQTNNGTWVVLQKALWQADPAIAKRAIDGEIDAILSGDSDYAMYVGDGGPDGYGDIMLRIPLLVKQTKQRMSSILSRFGLVRER
jgi:hypothetical protein